VAAGAIVASFLVTLPVVGVLDELSGETGQDLAGLASPMTMLLGIRGWLFNRVDAEIPPPGDFGPLYGLVVLGLVAVCVGLVMWRYRKVQA
jgi:ABC-2 type transport system permease protein